MSTEVNAGPATTPILWDACIRTPFATLGIRTSSQHVEAIQFLPTTTLAQVPRANSLAHLVAVQLMAYLDNSRYVFDLPLHLTGSKHQLDVWQAMCAIPSGEVRTYGALAADLGSSAQAVGTACGRNPLPIVVPCHRVTANGGLGGFMGGKRDGSLAIKRWLLAHERGDGPLWA